MSRETTPFEMSDSWAGEASGARDWYLNILALVKNTMVSVNGTNIEKLVDIAFNMKQLAETIDTIRKEVNKRREQLESIIGTKYVEESLNDDAEPIRGRFAVGTVKCKMIPTIPSKSKEPEAYSELLRVLGVPEELCGPESPVGIHWPALSEYVTRLAEQGKPVPTCIKSATPKFTLTYRSTTKNEEMTNGEEE